MNRIDRLFLGLLLAVTLLSSAWQFFQHPPETSLDYGGVPWLPVDDEETVEEDIPDFARILDVREKKATFFAFIKEKVDRENQKLSDLRKQLQFYSTKETLLEWEEAWIGKVAQHYNVDTEMNKADAMLEQLLVKVDEIPVSLALVQAANESAWGTSRFALEANNFYGQWCFSKGCGVVPEQRPEGARYEVRKFDSAAHSVRSYMHNLNSSHHYEGMRDIRSKQRSAGKPVTGPLLAQGLYAYSIRGVDYVNELVRMIEGNDLLRYDLLTTEQQ